MVGNLFDLSGDGQTAIFARSDPRAGSGSYAGDASATEYAGSNPPPDGDALDPTNLAPYDGPQPGFLGLTPWVLPSSNNLRDEPALPAGSTGSLESCTDGLVPGSGVTTGPCAENHELATAVEAQLQF